MITPDTDILTTDFIYRSERNATKTNDAGRVPKLESYGFLSLDFLNVGKGTVTYNSGVLQRMLIRAQAQHTHSHGRARF